MLTMNLLNDLYRQKKSFKPVCLFGPADPVEDEKMFEEAMMMARDNFINRWNFDVYAMTPANRQDGLKWEPTGQGNAREERGVTIDNVNINVVVTDDPGRLGDISGAARLVGDDDSSRLCSGVEARTAVNRGARFNPYNKQQKLTDMWRKRKPSGLSSRKNITSKTYEDSSDLMLQTSSSSV